MKIIAPVIAVSLLASGHAFTGSNDNPLCKPVQAFVASVKPDESRALTFRTAWGSNFKGETEPALFAKSCEHHGYKPAATACEALMEHGAVEFSSNNARRVLSCLSPETTFGSGVSLEHGAFSLMYGTPNRGANVTLEYGEDPATGSMTLRLAADGY